MPIRALLSIGNIDSFVRKLLDSEISHMIKHVVFETRMSCRSPFRVIVGCCFYRVDFCLLASVVRLLAIFIIGAMNVACTKNADNKSLVYSGTKA